MTCKTCQAYQAIVADLSRELKAARAKVDSANASRNKPHPDYHIRFDDEMDDWGWSKRERAGVASVPGFQTRSEAALDTFHWEAAMADKRTWEKADDATPT